MSEKATFVLAHETARRRAVECVMAAPPGFVVTVKPPARTLSQNDRLWALLAEVSQQVNWYGKKLTPEDWKHVFTASLRKLDVVPNLDGTGFVALGMSTSSMSKREFSDLMELIASFGAERGVKFSEQMEEA
jgi:hypothetical protein